jgi:hypothetical protein
MNWFQTKQGAAVRKPENAFLPKVTTISSVDEKTGEVKRMILTRERLERAFDKVNDDPLAGLGIFSKREELINEIMKEVNTCELPEQKQPGTAAPLLSEPKTPAPRSIRAVPTPSRSAAPQTPAAPVVPTTPTAPATLNLNLTNEAKGD